MDVDASIASEEIKLSDLIPNPYRNLEHDPIDPKRVENHVTSITGTSKKGKLWQPLNARKSPNQPGKYEIVFGHHRVEALRQIHGPDHEIDVILEDLADTEMLKRMATENDPIWNHGFRHVDGVVDKIKKSLETEDGKVDKEILKKFLHEESEYFRRGHRIRLGASLIHACLSKRWPLHVVTQSLERLNLLKEGAVDREALYLMPNTSAAMSFLNVVKKNKIKFEDQHEFAVSVKRTGTFGEKNQELTYVDFLKWRGQNVIAREGAIDFCDSCLWRASKAIDNAVRHLQETHSASTNFGLSDEMSFEVSWENLSPRTLKKYYTSLSELTKMVDKTGDWLDALKAVYEAENVGDL